MELFYRYSTSELKTSRMTLLNVHKVYLYFVRAQNNGRSPDNDRPKMPLDRSLFYLTGQFDRPHLYAFR